MATILGDWLKDVGNGLGKVFDGDILEGVGQVLGGTLKGAGRTIGFAGKTLGEAGNAVGNLIDGIFDDGQISPDEIPGEDKPTILLTSAVAVFAKMAKADGRVTRPEIDFLSAWIANLGLTGEDAQALKELANEAKSDEHSIEDYARLFYAASNCNTDVTASFYLDMVRMALADGEVSDEEGEILASIPECLGLDPGILDYISEHPEVLDGGDDGQEASGSSGGFGLEECYKTLGCSPDATDAEVRRCYKKQMAQYHPDAISGKDLAPAFIEFANQQSARINQAYETIKAARGMR